VLTSNQKINVGQEARTAYSSYPKGGFSCSKDSFVVNQTLVFQIRFCGKSSVLRLTANHNAQNKKSIQK